MISRLRSSRLPLRVCIALLVVLCVFVGVLHVVHSHGSATHQDSCNLCQATSQPAVIAATAWAEILLGPWGRGVEDRSLPDRAAGRERHPAEPRASPEMLA